MDVQLTYVSASCNRTPNACDWGKNGLICYASCYSVIIYDPKNSTTAKRVKTLVGHTNRVNTARWIRTKDDSAEKEIITASNDSTAIVWSLIDDNFKSNVLKGHGDGVNVAEAIYLDSNKQSLLVVTASIDSTCRVWKRNHFGDAFENIQIINFNRGLCLASSLTVLPNTNNILLACARDDSKIHLYAQSEESDSNIFKVVAVLKGHENWVRGLDFTTDDAGNILLASSAQDCFIRIWCISPSSEITDKKTIIERLAEHKMRAMETFFSVEEENTVKHFSVHLESVLCGHEGWVYSANWCPKQYNKDGSEAQPMKLLSSSLDKSMLIWTLDDATGLWAESVRVGEVGGNILGYYGSRFSPDGQSILGYGYLGSFHMWNFCSELNTWEPGVTIGGHYEEVIDLAWEPEGEFLLSASTDQTTRIHAPWIRKNDEISWHELARPQMHGYNMSSLAVISRYKFVSGAEEKIVRAFSAPSNFVTNFRKICNIIDDKEGDEILNEIGQRPKGASVPSLGLSNKAVYESNNETENKLQGKNAYPEDSYFHEVQLQAPPTEENLLQNTLWPEIQKLYGHGYEIFSLAASPDKSLVASACKATNSEHAAIILWCTKTWSIKQKLISHNLTVTQMMFSPDNKNLLSVSRDRRWSIFEKNPETNEYSLAATTDKKNGIHARIIWCCAWSHNSKYFVTASRDGRTVIWRKNPNKVTRDSLGSYEAVGLPLELKGESITAIAFASALIENNYLICLGLERGLLILYKWNEEQMWTECVRLSQSVAHHLTVKRIFFRPKLGQTGVAKSNENVIQVASCGADHAVKIFDIYLDK